MYMIEELEQGPLLTVHCKILVPLPNAFTALFAKPGLAIVPEPSSNVQLPEPAVGVLAAKKVFGLLMHNVWLSPAAATTLTVLTDTVTAALPLQAPLVPVNVYVLVMPGVTTMLLPFWLVLQV